MVERCFLFLRKYLLKTGFKILSETPIYENNKLYSVLLVRFTGKILNETPGYYYIGEVIPNTQAGLLYIEKQKNESTSAKEIMIYATKTIIEILDCSLNPENDHQETYD